MSSTDKIASPEFHSCFARFIELLDASEWKMDYLEGNPTGVTAAYYAFLDSMANEVRDVPQGNAWGATQAQQLGYHHHTY